MDFLKIPHVIQFSKNKNFKKFISKVSANFFVKFDKIFVKD